MSNAHTPADFRRLWWSEDGASMRICASIREILERGNREVSGLEKFQPEVIANVKTMLECDGWTVTGDAGTAGRWIIVPAKLEPMLILETGTVPASEPDEGVN